MAIALESRSREEYLRWRQHVRQIFAGDDAAWTKPGFPDWPEKLLEPRDFVAQLGQAVLESDQRLRHPLSVRLVRGELSLDEIRALVVVNYPYLIQTIRNDAMIVAKAKNLAEMRKQLLVLIEEAGEDIVGGDTPAHPTLWLRFGLALGLTEEQITDQPVHPLTRSFLDAAMLRGLMRPIGAAPTNLRLGERAQSIIFPIWRETLASTYQLADEALLFFDAHGEADWGHGGIGEDVILTRCRTLEAQRDLWEAAKRGCAEQFHKFDVWQIAMRDYLSEKE